MDSAYNRAKERYVSAFEQLAAERAQNDKEVRDLRHEVYILEEMQRRRLSLEGSKEERQRLQARLQELTDSMNLGHTSCSHDKTSQCDFAPTDDDSSPPFVSSPSTMPSSSQPCAPSSTSDATQEGSSPLATVTTQMRPQDVPTASPTVTKRECLPQGGRSQGTPGLSARRTVPGVRNGVATRWSSPVGDPTASGSQAQSGAVRSPSSGYRQLHALRSTLPVGLSQSPCLVRHPWVAPQLQYGLPGALPAAGTAAWTAVTGSQNGAQRVDPRVGAWNHGSLLPHRPMSFAGVG